MTSTQRGDGKVLKFVTCLQILLFLNNRLLFIFADGGWVGGGFGCHNCIILNIITYFDKKVTFLALVPVLK